MSLLPQGKSWTVRDRRLVSRLVVSPIMAPLLEREDRIVLSATCPAGHDMPFEVSADEAVVRSVESTGVTLGCDQCLENYKLDLGEWPLTSGRVL
jgi:hypothetical protein